LSACAGATWPPISEAELPAAAAAAEVEAVGDMAEWAGRDGSEKVPAAQEVADGFAARRAAERGSHAL
jgi:hypothetical protein